MPYENGSLNGWDRINEMLTWLSPTNIATNIINSLDTYLTSQDWRTPVGGVASDNNFDSFKKKTVDDYSPICWVVPDAATRDAMDTSTIPSGYEIRLLSDGVFYKHDGAGGWYESGSELDQSYCKIYAPYPGVRTSQLYNSINTGSTTLEI